MKTIKTNKQEPYYSFCLEGKKTIEGRLNKGKFAKLEIGDILSVNNQTDFEIISKKAYPSFEEMLIGEGISNVVPNKASLEEAVSAYRQFYTLKQEKEFGVLALGIKRIKK